MNTSVDVFHFLVFFGLDGRLFIRSWDCSTLCFEAGCVQDLVQ